ncbi:E3 ubiquitin-protein ligase wav3 [Thalictrum thalictroides]|uniref:RING-type E3 ubiquitin transferase n=1 Tax=Thalictrum thalictroides TaxID=46969 RepID=A0A7J6V9R9_THATH|nr:E3 ubiquitin-protein ligase wav3 [Thalictrum thalictroides]
MGWRRAFCTSIPRDSQTSFSDKQQISPNPSPSPRSRIKFGFLSSSGSNPSTPRFQSQSQSVSSSTSPSLRCRTTTSLETQQHDSPKLLQCKTTSCASIKSSPRLFQNSNPSSPKSPSRFSLFKTSLRLSRNSCGICLQNVKTGQGTAIFTAECSHAFHFPCIAAHVRKQHADEENQQEEDIEEFQGFFVNPNPPFKSDDQTNSLDSKTSRNVDVKLLPVAAVVSVGKNHETYAIALKIKAPPPPPRAHNSKSAKLLDPGRRAPIDLVTVLDTSRSMTGAKLQMLKRAMRLVISSLGSADRLSIIAFSSSPKRLLALRRMTTQGQRSARRIIDRLVCGQGSSVGDALRKATKVLEDRRERNPVASIMLLSDGQDERSSCAANSSANRRRVANSANADMSSTRFAHLEIPVHSFGFGENSGHSHEPAEDAFAKCVGGLLSVVVQDLRIQLGFSSGSTPAEITAVYSCNGRPTSLGSGSGSVRLGDLYTEEERELLVELRVPTVPVGAHHVMSVRCSYKDPVTQEVINGKEQALLVPRPHAVRSSDPKIEQLRNLFVTNRAIAEARRCIEHSNDLSTAHRMLTSTRALLKQASSISADEYLSQLEVELKELQYLRQKQQQVYQHQQSFPPHVMIQRRRTSEREPAYLDENGEPLTPTSAWRAAEQLAKVAIMRKSMNKVGDLHGFENARF